MSKKRNPGGPFVEVEDCQERHGVTAARVDRLELALYGKDGRGGMVRDISEIKTQTRALKTVLVPLVASVLSALITAGILEGLSHIHL